MKRILSLAVVVIAAVAHGVAQEARTTLPASEQPSELLRRIANNPALPLEERSAAISKLFQERLGSGFSSAEVASLLKETSWLNETTVTQCLGVGGMLQVVPSCSNPNLERTFRLEPFASKNKSFAIEFRLRGTQFDGSAATPEVVLDFLKGHDVLQPGAALTEVALCFPRAAGAPGRQVFHYSSTGQSEYETAW